MLLIKESPYWLVEKNREVTFRQEKTFQRMPNGPSLPSTSVRRPNAHIYALEEQSIQSYLSYSSINLY